MKLNFISSLGGGEFFRLHSKSAAYMAFAAMVLVCLLAAATVVSHDVPLMLGGL